MALLRGTIPGASSALGMGVRWPPCGSWVLAKELTEEKELWEEVSRLCTIREERSTGNQSQDGEAGSLVISGNRKGGSFPACRAAIMEWVWCPGKRWEWTRTTGGGIRASWACGKRQEEEWKTSDRYRRFPSVGNGSTHLLLPWCDVLGCLLSAGAWIRDTAERLSRLVWSLDFCPLLRICMSTTDIAGEWRLLDSGVSSVLSVGRRGLDRR